MSHLWLLMWLVGSALAGPEPPAPSAAIAAEMATLRDWIRNAQVKLRAGGVGLTGADARPAQRCCALNVTRIEESTRRLGELLAELDACYDAAHDSQMMANLAFVRSDLEGVREVHAAFAGASEERVANGALDALARGYLRLGESLGGLSPCEPRAAGTGKDKGRNKEKTSGRKTKSSPEPSPSPD